MAAKPEEATEEKKNINRREFLNLAWLASLGFVAINLGGVVYLFSMPRFKEGEFGGTVTIGTVGDLPQEDGPPENFPKVKLWLSYTEEGISALYKVCTHLGCLYNWNSQEGKFICPCHGSQFTEDGDFIQGPAPRSLDQFLVEAVDPKTGEVVAANPEGNPLPVPDDSSLLIRVNTGVKIVGERHA